MNKNTNVKKKSKVCKKYVSWKYTVKFKYIISSFFLFALYMYGWNTSNSCRARKIKKEEEAQQ